MIAPLAPLSSPGRGVRGAWVPPYCRAIMPTLFAKEIDINLGAPELLILGCFGAVFVGLIAAVVAVFVFRGQDRKDE